METAGFSSEVNDPGVRLATHVQLGSAKVKMSQLYLRFPCTPSCFILSEQKVNLHNVQKVSTSLQKTKLLHWKISWLILFREITAVQSENSMSQKKHSVGEKYS